MKNERVVLSSVIFRTTPYSRLGGVSVDSAQRSAGRSWLTAVPSKIRREVQVRAMYDDNGVRRAALMSAGLPGLMLLEF